MIFFSGFVAGILVSWFCVMFWLPSAGRLGERIWWACYQERIHLDWDFRYGAISFFFCRRWRQVWSLPFLLRVKLQGKKP